MFFEYSSFVLFADFPSLLSLRTLLGSGGSSPTFRFLLNYGQRGFKKYPGPECPGREGSLLRIKFYDQLLLDVLRNAFTLRVHYISTLEFFFVYFNPVDALTLRASHTSDVGIGLALRLQFDNVTSFQAERRDVY